MLNGLVKGLTKAQVQLGQRGTQVQTNWARKTQVHHSTRSHPRPGPWPDPQFNPETLSRVQTESGKNHNLQVENAIKYFHIQFTNASHDTIRTKYNQIQILKLKKT